MNVYRAGSYVAAFASGVFSTISADAFIEGDPMFGAFQGLIAIVLSAQAYRGHKIATEEEKPRGIAPQPYNP